MAGTIELRPMGIGDILDTALRLYRSRFGTFLAIAAVAYVPYAIGILLLNMAIVPAAVAAEAQTRLIQQDSRLRLLTSIQNLLFFIIVWPLVQAALTRNISAAFLGQRLSASESYRGAKSAMGRLIGTQFMVGFAVVFGFLLLIVPGVIFSLWFMLVPVVVILEGLGGSRAMGRSRELMRGNLNKGFAMSFIVGIINAAATFVVGMLAGMLPLPHPAFLDLILNLTQAILLPVLTAPIILLYYDLRIRKEAFDLQHLAAAMPAEGTA